ncbi:DUF4214 domain-containing protein [uncultured Thiocystis sp.]|uniref:DUF7948 domain-containing protein n=1 Tax=uncultured Thiocystis sp. TaxID=1202134 RepID=UPI0025EF82A9|nr:DUF4214 domain-containing protein [uncultured Thiocystis sp.]
MHKPFVHVPLFAAVFCLSLVLPRTPQTFAAETPQQLKSLNDRVAPANVQRLSGFPLRFVPNQGQWDQGFEFLVQIANADVFFTPRDVVLKMHDGGLKASVLRMRPLNAAPTMHLVPGERLPTRVSYFCGQDPAQWRTAVPTYANVRYQAVYPGVDLLFRDDGQQMAYDFVLAPGADPSQIRVAMEGVKKLALDEDGVMIMTLPNGLEVRQKAPSIYQMLAGERVRVEGHFEIPPGNADLAAPVFGFQVAGYDPTQPLIIDPTLDYSTFVGGAKDEDARAMDVTAAGEVIIAGSTLSPTFPEVPEEQVILKKDAVVYQVSADGSALDYVVILGGAGDEQINGVALDGDELYLTGQTNSTNFPVSLDAMYPLLPGGKAQAAFVAKLASDQTIDFSTYFGGSGVDAGHAISLEFDTTGTTVQSIYVAGETASSDLVIRNALYPVNKGITDGFLLKLSANGDILYSSSFFGGTKRDVIKFISVQGDGSLYLAGETASTDLPVKNQLQAYGGDIDVFVTRMARAGLELVSSTFLGGKKNDILTGMVLDDDKNILLSGYTASTDFPLKNALYGKYAGGTNDGFLAKIDYSARFLHFSTYLGDSADDKAMAIALDQTADTDGLKYLYVAGETASNNFPTENAYQTYYAGGKDGFLMKLDPRGLRVVNSTYFGGTKDETVTLLGTPSLAAKQAFLAGNTKSTSTDSFPLSESPAYAVHAGSIDNFVAKLTDIEDDPFIPILGLEFNSLNPEFPVAPFVTAMVEVALTLDKHNGSEISAFSTVLNYDAKELEYQSVVWTGPIPGGSQAVASRIDSTVPGKLTIRVYQDANPVSLDGLTATLTFEVLNVGIVTGPPLASSQLLLTLDQPWAADMDGLDTFIHGAAGGILVDRRRNKLLGDCDVSGQVRIWEFEQAVLLYLDALITDPVCVKLDYATPSMDAADLQAILTDYLSNTVAAITGASPGESGGFLSNVSTSTEIGGSLSFAPARLDSGGIGTDLVLNAGGHDISTLMTDVTYDPSLFAAADAVIAPSVQAAGKGLVTNLVKPGWLRILIYGLNLTAIPDGVVATVKLDPIAGAGLTNTHLSQTPDASTPDAKPVPLRGNTLVAGVLSPRNDPWRVAEIYMATLGYAPDNEGLQYWVDQIATRPEWTPTTVAQSFFDQPLVQAEYPDALGNTGLIDALYRNLFGRAPDAEGKAYWLADLQAGRIRRNEMIVALIEGGWSNPEAASDMARFGNRVDVALAFAAYQSEHRIVYSRLSAADRDSLRQIGQDVLSNVTDDPETAGSAIARIPELLEPFLY